MTLAQLRARFVDDCRAWWKFWSLRLTAIGVVLQSWITIAPDSLSAVWGQTPGEVRDLLPLWLVKTIPIALFVAAMVARLMKQRKLQK